MSLTLTLVRHGESTDNLKSLWAGHRDAPLTTHGMNQARRLGKSFEDVYISKIYASDLKRAHWTALQIATQNKSLLERIAEEDRQGGSVTLEGTTPRRPVDNDKDDDDENNPLADEDEDEIANTSAGLLSIVSTDRLSGTSNSEYNDDFSCSSSAAASSPISPSITSNGNLEQAREARTRGLLSQTVTTTPLLREQFFGLAEGQNWRTGFATSSNSYHNRGYRFEQGESLEDVHARAIEVVERCVVNWLVEAWRSGEEKHVVLVAHGIMISELLFALARLQDPRAPYTRQSGHTNTGWTRMQLTFPLNFLPSSEALPTPILPPLLSTDLPPYYREPSPGSGNAYQFSPRAPVLPKVTLRQTHVNHTLHLSGLKRQKGGIGSEGFDARQSTLRSFFAGAASGASMGGENEGESEVQETGSSSGGSADKEGSGSKTPVDLTKDSDEEEVESVKRDRIRVMSPPSPSPKKGRLT